MFHKRKIAYKKANSAGAERHRPNASWRQYIIPQNRWTVHRSPKDCNSCDDME